MDLPASVAFRSVGQIHKPLSHSGLWDRLTNLCRIQVCGPNSQPLFYSGLWARLTNLCCIQVCGPNSQPLSHSGLWAKLATPALFRSVGQTHKPLFHSGLWAGLQILAEYVLCNRYTDYNIMPQSSLPKTTNQTKTATESTPRHQFYRRSRKVFFNKSHPILTFIASTSCSHLPLPGSRV